MAETTKISWCDATFNPWIGCTKIGPGCDHCYAERDMDHRRHYVQWGSGKPRRRTSDNNWKKPYEWNAKPAKLIKDEWPGRKPRVFSASLADIFDNEVPEDWQTDFWNVVEDCSALEWLIVTKRIGNVGKMSPPTWSRTNFSHVILLITVVNQEEADRDIPKLIAIKESYPWLRIGLSIEPMLGPIDLAGLCTGWHFIDCLRGVRYHDAPIDVPSATQQCPSIDWVICGGESGFDARPMNPAWVRTIRRQCADANVPFQFKQWGTWIPGEVYSIGDSQGHARHIDGQEHRGKASHWWEGDVARGLISTKVGAAIAGRMLDGIEHNGFPA